MSGRTPRVFSARFPHLALITAWTGHHELRAEPVVIGGAPELRLPVLAASEAATAAGVRPGQPLRQAQQLCPAAVFVALDPHAVDRLRERLVTGLLEIAPRVDAGDDSILADISGRHAAYSGEAAWAAALARHLAALLAEDGIRAGVAGSRQVAEIAAALAEPRHIRRIPPGEEAGFLAPLPLHHLGLDPAIAGRLAALGLDQIGAVAGLSAADLQRQFGRVGLDLWRRARGENAGGVTATRTGRRLGERLILEGGVEDLEALRFAVHRAAAEVGERLRDAGLLGERVELRCEFEDAAPVTHRLLPSRPVGGPAELWDVALELLGSLTLTAPVTAIRLEVEGLLSGAGRQVDLWRGGDASREAIAGMTARLRRRYGGEAVRRPTLAVDPGDLPERRFCWEGAATVETIAEPPKPPRNAPGTPTARVPAIPPAMPAVRW